MPEYIGRDNYAKAALDARELFLRYDQEKMIRTFGLEADAAYLYIRFFDGRYRIERQTAAVERQAPDGQYTGPCGFNEVMSIYDALCYPKGAPQLSGRWCTAASLPGTAHASLLERRMCERQESLFDRRQAAFARACRAMGAQPVPMGDLGFRFEAFPFLPLVLRFYASDEEFPPQLSVLWDSHVLDFVHYETIYYIAGYLLGRLAEAVERDTDDSGGVCDGID